MKQYNQKVSPVVGDLEGAFKEWLLLKRYSPATAATTVRIVAYFRQWALSENITELEEIRYQDAMMFISWSAKHGASQKTIANYLTHIRKFYAFLASPVGGGLEGAENPVAHIKVQGIKRKVYYDILNTDELQQLYQNYPTKIEQSLPPSGERKGGFPPQQKNIISRRRNKVILSLLIYQGLRVEEVAAINLQDLQLREGKITIHSQRRTAARTMQLESHQVYELMDYVHEVRKEMIVLMNKSPSFGGVGEALFLQWKQGENFYGITQMLLQHLRKINSRLKNFDQIRASVITQWLKQYDLRKVQYLAGHKYVSSTEAYKALVIDELQDDITKFHPL